VSREAHDLLRGVYRSYFTNLAYSHAVGILLSIRVFVKPSCCLIKNLTVWGRFVSVMSGESFFRSVLELDFFGDFWYIVDILFRSVL